MNAMSGSVHADIDDQAVFTALWLSNQTDLTISLDYEHVLSQSSNWQSRRCDFAPQPTAGTGKGHVVCSSTTGSCSPNARTPLLFHFNGHDTSCQVRPLVVCSLWGLLARANT